MPKYPTLKGLKTLTQRPELQYLLEEAQTLPDSALTALGYLLWTLTRNWEALDCSKHERR